MEQLLPNLYNIRVPAKCDKVYKDECVFSFDTPECPTGLYVCMSTFVGVGRDFLEMYHKKTGNSVFLHIVRKAHEHHEDKLETDNEVTRLAIGVDGGFPTTEKKNIQYSEEYSVVIFPDLITLSYPNNDLPEGVALSVKGIIDAEPASKLTEVERAAGTWDGEVLSPSKHAHNLYQANNGKKIPPRGWKCEKCGVETNLWLNLSDGSILCGRRFFDGSGGNNHAVEHYHETKFPLAVKLGTITKDGKADVYSYEEDDMVTDPFLKDHLGHWGINIAEMEKTERTMIELELDLNKNANWFSAHDANWSPLIHPAFTGLANLGNTCYVNSVMQVLFKIPDFKHVFVDSAKDIIQDMSDDPANDFNVQMAKLGYGLCSGKYSPICKLSHRNDYPDGLSPSMFRNVMSKNHPEFSTKRQQDAQEFFMHIIDLLVRHRKGRRNPADCFKFSMEDRFQCTSSRKVKYMYHSEYCLSLNIPIDAAINKEEVKAFVAMKADLESKGQKVDDSIVRPFIKWNSCLEELSKTEIIQGFYSAELKERTIAQKLTRMATFPDYLMIHLKKFTLREDWVPIKLDVAVDMPKFLHLSQLRALGPQPGEEVITELEEETTLKLDDKLLSQLVDMGYPLEACKKALYFTENASLELASSWLMGHVADKDFADPFLPPGYSQKCIEDFPVDPQGVEMITAMGFTEQHARAALKATKNDTERAMDWILSNMSTFEEPKYRDGEGNYELVAFISHLGTSSMSGHYIAYILHEDRWAVLNDDRIGTIENPPIQLGYLYLYKRAML